MRLSLTLIFVTALAGIGHTASASAPYLPETAIQFSQDNYLDTKSPRFGAKLRAYLDLRVARDDYWKKANGVPWDAGLFVAALQRSLDEFTKADALEERAKQFASETGGTPPQVLRFHATTRAALGEYNFNESYFPIASFTTSASGNLRSVILIVSRCPSTRHDGWYATPKQTPVAGYGLEYGGLDRVEERSPHGPDHELFNIDMLFNGQPGTVSSLALKRADAKKFVASFKEGERRDVEITLYFALFPQRTWTTQNPVACIEHVVMRDARNGQILGADNLQPYEALVSKVHAGTHLVNWDGTSMSGEDHSTPPAASLEQMSAPSEIAGNLLVDGRNKISVNFVPGEVTSGGLGKVLGSRAAATLSIPNASTTTVSSAGWSLYYQDSTGKVGEDFIALIRVNGNSEPLVRVPGKSNMVFVANDRRVPISAQRRGSQCSLMPQGTLAAGRYCAIFGTEILLLEVQQ